MAGQTIGEFKSKFFLPSHKQEIVSKWVWAFPGGKKWDPLFGLRKELSCAVPKVRSPLELVAQSASAAWDVSLGQYLLHDPAVTIAQAWGQCVYQHKVERFSLVHHPFPAARFLQANYSLMNTPKLVGSVNTDPRTAHCVLSAVFQIQNDNDETFVHLFLSLPSDKTVSNSFQADQAYRKQQGLCPPCRGEGKKKIL